MSEEGVNTDPSTKDRQALISLAVVAIIFVLFVVAAAATWPKEGMVCKAKSRSQVVYMSRPWLVLHMMNRFSHFTHHAHVRAPHEHASFPRSSPGRCYNPTMVRFFSRKHVLERTEPIMDYFGGGDLMSTGVAVPRSLSLLFPCDCSPSCGFCLYMGSPKIVDSGIAEGSCFFRDGEDHDPLEHGYLFDADGDLEGYLAYDLSKRKVVQCEIIWNRR